MDGGSTTVYRLSGPALRGAAVDERSTFQIGSVTKTFTATALAEMVQSGAVSLSDPIGKYFPPGTTAPEYNGQPIALLNLAEQNSALPRLPANLSPTDEANPYAGYGTAQLYGFLSSYQLTRAPGAQYEYSNLGVGLLGDLLAREANETYPELIERAVLQPLGLSGTTARGTAATRTRLVQGYAEDGTPQPPWDFDALAAAGSIESDLHDMLIYLHANMTPPQSAIGRAMTFAQQPRVPIGLNGILQIGLVWNTNMRSGITWHNGETGGYHAFVGFDRAGRGVVLLANVADSDLDALAVHILAPYVPAPIARTYEPSPYAGRYPLTPAFAIRIFQSGGKLYEQATAQEAAELTRVSGQTFAVQGVDATITFELDAHGNATGLTLHQNGANLHAPKQAAGPP